MNMDFEQLLKQEVQKAARQDYEEITAKAQDYPYKFSKEREDEGDNSRGKKESKEKKTSAYFAGCSDSSDTECRHRSGK